MLTITANAKKYLERKIQENFGQYIFLTLKPSGCAGFEYDWKYTKAYSTPSQHLIDGLLVVDDKVLEKIYGSTIDYTEELIGSSLKVINPNVQDACGCGVSFTF